MSQKPNNRLPNHHGDQDVHVDDATGAAFDRRADFVRSRLRLLGRVLKTAQLEAAILLVECRSKGYWAEEYSSFTEYVEEEVGIPMRTAQEMMRVIRKCSDTGVPLTTVVELGWSKIALVASQLTRENAAELLTEVRSKSYSQLQEIMRQKKRQQKNHHKKGKQPDAQVDQAAPAMLSETFQEAIRLACLHTRNQKLEANLEFIAAKFMELCPPPSRLPSGPNLN